MTAKPNKRYVTVTAVAVTVTAVAVTVTVVAVMFDDFHVVEFPAND